MTLESQVLMGNTTHKTFKPRMKENYLLSFRSLNHFVDDDKASKGPDHVFTPNPQKIARNYNGLLNSCLRKVTVRCIRENK